MSHSDDPRVAALTRRIKELQAVLTDLRRCRNCRVARLRAKQRYQDDLEYRERMKARAREAAAQKRKKPSDGPGS